MAPHYEVNEEKRTLVSEEKRKLVNEERERVNFEAYEKLMSFDSPERRLSSLEDNVVKLKVRKKERINW